MNPTRVGKRLRALFMALAIAGLTSIGAPAVLAQAVFSVDYFSNANTPGAPDGTLRIDNPGLFYGPVCAHIYVFEADQQLSECCGCVQTPDGLRTLSVNNDLTSNPLTGVKLNAGIIEIVGSSDQPPCESISFNFTKVLISWVTQPQDKGKEGYPIGETTFSASTLGATELANLQAQCAFIQVLGSGQGICTCGTGD